MLVDTGLGLHDYLRPTLKMRFFMFFWRVVRVPDLAAVRKLKSLGYDPHEVSDIILTHLHLDHAGGLPDFPNACVHISYDEYKALQRCGLFCKLGLNQADFAHGPRWQIHRWQGGSWYDFNAICIPGIEPETYLVPLKGHTPGHCGVAIRKLKNWIFLCGDAAPANLDAGILPRLAYRLSIGPHLPRLINFAEEHPEVQLIASHMRQDFYQAPQIFP